MTSDTQSMVVGNFDQPTQERNDWTLIGSAKPLTMRRPAGSNWQAGVASAISAVAYRSICLRRWSVMWERFGMTVVVVPTLEMMIEIYSLSSVGGDRSDRFTTYVEACRAGELLHGYNPMTTKPVAAVLESLVALNVEEAIREASSETLDRLGVDDNFTMFASVSAPGMWTDRQATTIEHRLSPRHVGEVLFWFDDDLDLKDIRDAAIEQTVRAVWWTHHQDHQPTLQHVSDREGLAGVLAGRSGNPSGVAAETLDILGPDISRATAACYLFGDHAANHLGHPALGINENEGLNHSTARVTKACSDTSVRDVARTILGTTRRL